MNDEEFTKELRKKLSELGLYSESENKFIEPESNYKLYNPDTIKKVSSLKAFIKKNLTIPGFTDEIKFEIDPIFNFGILTYITDSLDIPSILMGEFGINFLDATSVSVNATLDGKIKIEFLYDDFIIRK